MAKGDVSLATALEAGFCDLRDSRENINFWRSASIGSALFNVSESLAEFGVDSDFELLGDLHQDACGLYTKLTQRWQKREAQREALSTRRFDRFVVKLLKLGAKQGDNSAVSSVTGRTRPVGLPMITTDGTLTGFQQLVREHIADAMLLVTPGTPEGGNEGEIDVQAKLTGIGDPGVVNTIPTWSLSASEGTVVIDELSLGNSGTGTQTVPCLSNTPFISRLFRSATAEGEKTSLLALVTPHIILESRK